MDTIMKTTTRNHLLLMLLKPLFSKQMAPEAETKTIPKEILELQEENRRLQDESKLLKTENKTLRRNAENMQEELSHIRELTSLLSRRDLILALANEDYEQAYPIIGTLDPGGFYLYRAAKRYTGIKLENYYCAEDSRGYFEDSNGYELLEWLESAAFGSCEWETLDSGTGYELSYNRTINKNTETYRQYRREITRKVVIELLGLQDGN